MGNNHKKTKTQLPFRLNILFFTVFLLFSTLVLQLGIVQILNGEDLQEEINKTDKVITKNPSPRGEIYDRNGEVVVSNEPLYSITYTPTQATSSVQKLEVAKKLSNLIDMPEDKLDDITVSDRKDYWYLLKEMNEEDPYEGIVSDEEKASSDDAYGLLMDRLTEEQLSYSGSQMNEIAILHELMTAYALAPHPIKNKGVTQEEYAKVAEHLFQLPGVDVTTDYDRTYTSESTFKSFIGKYEEGIPKEQKDFYLSHNYSLNDRVGISGLEKEYELQLAGQKEIVEHTTDKAGNLIDSKIVNEGKPGDDLVLSIDMEFQQRVDEILKEEFKAAIDLDPFENKYMDSAMAVVMDPNTGEVLAASGQEYNRETNEFRDVATDTIYNAYLPGSTVKGATILAGLDSSAIDPGTTFQDEPIQIKGTATLASYKNFGYLNEVDALAVSSNVYMWKTAMRMMGNGEYVPNDTLSYDEGSFEEMQNYFKQFGLGVQTGVDMYPEEAVGVRDTPKENKGGQMLNFSIGQYNTYTTMQLAQYVSTIANGGYRVKPNIVKEFRTPNAQEEELGPIVKSYETEVLNKVSMSDEDLARVQQGFFETFNTEKGTADGYFSGKSDYVAAGKTGTAQEQKWLDVKNDEGEITGYKPVDVENLTLVGYASGTSLDEPDLAFAVVVPYAGIEARHYINKLIGERILDTYYELQKTTGDSDEEDSTETE
ncbi:penicillin-binding protein [Pontibacillus halophilus JSM 076056 = DSM 19796]|uniref:serine-type D-Ala-D-Ala carboxypeptidase n=1 Tax=Pontibacillus halophilus JSM 076056 = DSM 19796 TaxID=1385510 RepID=A0A0A5GCD7_9BACI|nr:penicillin-binding protein 2 [Pontibacillus halophilus]KGX90851.1 penicillin-binding protein [Pontibacillus halophilus JSM 076056 = DSM 19796]